MNADANASPELPLKLRPRLESELALGWPHVRIAGVDEAGRGPLVGDVVAAAVILPGPADWLDQLNDSKKLSAKKREELALKLLDQAHVGVGSCTPAEIDQLNILWASMLAMERAISALPVVPQHCLIDGNRLPKALDIPATAIVRGDARSQSIAAASIIAKVERDQRMYELAEQFPGYGFERNKGYPTAQHRSALDRLGPTPHHRKSFKLGG